MIGPLELLVLLVILLLIFHKRLPGLGRSAGANAKIGSEKAREFADRNAPKAKELASQATTKGGEVGTKVGAKFDPEATGRRAGKGLRDARDMRSSFKNFLDPPPKQEAAPAAKPAPAPEPAAASNRAADPEPTDPEPPGPAADAQRRPDADDTTA